MEFSISKRRVFRIATNPNTTTHTHHTAITPAIPTQLPAALLPSRRETESTPYTRTSTARPELVSPGGRSLSVRLPSETDSFETTQTIVRSGCDVCNVRFSTADRFTHRPPPRLIIPVPRSCDLRLLAKAPPQNTGLREKDDFHHVQRQAFRGAEPGRDLHGRRDGLQVHLPG